MVQFIQNNCWHSEQVVSSKSTCLVLFKNSKLPYGNKLKRETCSVYSRHSRSQMVILSLKSQLNLIFARSVKASLKIQVFTPFQNFTTCLRKEAGTWNYQLLEPTAQSSHADTCRKIWDKPQDFLNCFINATLEIKLQNSDGARFEKS